MNIQAYHSLARHGLFPLLLIASVICALACSSDSSTNAQSKHFFPIGSGIDKGVAFFQANGAQYAVSFEKDIKSTASEETVNQVVSGSARNYDSWYRLRVIDVNKAQEVKGIRFERDRVLKFLGLLDRNAWLHDEQQGLRVLSLPEGEVLLTHKQLMERNPELKGKLKYNNKEAWGYSRSFGPVLNLEDGRTFRFDSFSAVETEVNDMLREFVGNGPAATNCKGDYIGERPQDEFEKESRKAAAQGRALKLKHVIGNCKNADTNILLIAGIASTSGPGRRAVLKVDPATSSSSPLSKFAF